MAASSSAIASDSGFTVGQVAWRLGNSPAEYRRLIAGEAVQRAGCRLTQRASLDSVRTCAASSSSPSLSPSCWAPPCRPPAVAVIPRGRYAIGDSVMLGAAELLRARGIQVHPHARARQFGDALGIVRDLKHDGRLKRKIIVHLGTNGVAIDPDNCDALARSVGRDRRLFLVTIRIERTYRRAQNARLKQCANRHRNTRLIDWYAYSHDHPGWFYSDGYHLNGTGRVRYADLLDRRTS